MDRGRLVAVNWRKESSVTSEEAVPLRRALAGLISTKCYTVSSDSSHLGKCLVRVVELVDNRFVVCFNGCINMGFLFLSHLILSRL